MTGNKNPTDLRLIALFKEQLDIDIMKQSDKVFFTNAVQCYKKGTLQAPVHEEWFKCCSQYIKRLISIIEPKVVIPLGQKAFNALSLCGELINCPSKINPYRNVVESSNAIKLKINDEEKIVVTRIFPVYHCGTRIINTCRNFKLQSEDWAKIKQYLDNN